VFVFFYSNKVKRPEIATQNDLKTLYIEPRVSVIARCIFAGNRLKRQGEGAVWVSPGQFAVAHKERVFFENDSSISFSCLALGFKWMYRAPVASIIARRRTSSK
jgi:hypothetical protein